jgi:hypothetical protein
LTKGEAEGRGIWEKSNFWWYYRWYRRLIYNFSAEIINSTHLDAS